MLAIVDLNGKQYQVEEGRYVTVDRLALDENEPLELSNVLMIVDGEASLVGAPFVEGATVKAKVLRHTRGAKVLVYKMRCKKGYRRKNGHRQDYTQLQIEVVDFPGKQARPAKQEAAEQPKKAVAKKTTEKAQKPAEKSAPQAEVAAENTEA
ncbi:MAG TPA: 50S ribosomal protein L21 [Coleofasciculaceae cyanobacterium]|jgi:large subunit ribosomal protein L21